MRYPGVCLGVAAIVDLLPPLHAPEAPSCLPKKRYTFVNTGVHKVISCMYRPGREVNEFKIHAGFSLKSA